MLDEARAAPGPSSGGTEFGSIDETIRRLSRLALSRAGQLRSQPCGFRNRIRDRFEAAARGLSWM